jgi:hypothetical protein
MKHISHLANNVAATDWQILGELEVGAGSDVEQDIDTWLTESLKPLGLQGDVRHRIWDSAFEAARRALELNEAPTGKPHIHLLAFAPRHPRSNRHTWGFFRLEKLAQRPAGQTGSVHSIEFYLYAEGHCGSDERTAQGEVKA